MVNKEKVEPETEGNDEHGQYDDKAGHGVEDVLEHEDEDAEGGELLEVGEQVEPGQGQDEGADGPFPALQWKKY
jgi:hypothetical protein